MWNLTVSPPEDRPLDLRELRKAVPKQKSQVLPCLKKSDFDRANKQSKKQMHHLQMHLLFFMVFLTFLARNKVSLERVEIEMMGLEE